MSYLFWEKRYWCCSLDKNYYNKIILCENFNAMSVPCSLALFHFIQKSENKRNLPSVTLLVEDIWIERGWVKDPNSSNPIFCCSELRTGQSIVIWTKLLCTWERSVMEDLIVTSIPTCSRWRRILVLALRGTWRPITDALQTKVIILCITLTHSRYLMRDTAAKN